MVEVNSADSTMYLTAELRQVVQRYPGPVPRFQQLWRCGVTGEGEWRDVPTIYGDKVPNPAPE